jgi:hypothetical protein
MLVGQGKDRIFQREVAPSVRPLSWVDASECVMSVHTHTHSFTHLLTRTTEYLTITLLFGVAKIK